MSSTDHLVSGDQRASPDALFAGVDIGGTTTQAVLCDADLTVLARADAATPARVSGEAMVRVAGDLVAGLADGRPLSGVGVGAAGVVDAVEGRILVASDSFTGWSGFPVTRILGDRLGAPTYLDNDVNAFLRGEVNTGAIAGASEALGITLGTGVGGALWLDGRLWDGPRGAAGEIGHIPGFSDDPCTCGGRGHLETLASGRSIARRYEERAGAFSGTDPITARVVGERAAEGDLVALGVLADAAAGVARGILITVGLLDVATVVVGGGVTHSWDLLGRLIRESLESQPPVSGAPIRLERAGLGADAVTLGSAARARFETLRVAP
ncbi:sugar kinase [Frondihabitans sucicola]|uniref:Sugar kinase n=1 Tax=Frondihabitans sucicola TaxID=1268041 RepID=A0ABM8GI95_9MICO|nr:ROK family protein [Frondihabitans sucicola]BDZ47890.1 sugar kinase [Frondihabitans sucicola]